MPAGLGHLVLLEVGLHGNAVLCMQCPKQDQPQDSEQRGVHVSRRAKLSRAEQEEQAECCSAGESGKPLFMGRLCGGPRGGQPCLPPLPLCKQEPGRARKPKGRQGNLQMFPSC